MALNRAVKLPRVRTNNPVLTEVLNEFAERIEDALNKEIHLGRNLTGFEDDISLVIDSEGEATQDVAEEDPNAFDLTIDISSGSPKAQIYPGACNNIVPENILEDLNIPGGQMSYVILRCYTDGSGHGITRCELMVTTQEPAPIVPTKLSLPQQVDVPLHLIDHNSENGQSSYTPYRVFFPATNVRLTSSVAFQTTAEDSDGGAPSYDQWYTWAIGAA